jgi:hypothetical protein
MPSKADTTVVEGSTPVRVTLAENCPVHVQFPDGSQLVATFRRDDALRESEVLIAHHTNGPPARVWEMFRVPQLWDGKEYECRDEERGDSGCVVAANPAQAAALYVAENDYQRPGFDEYSCIQEITVYDHDEDREHYEHVQLDPHEPECVVPEGHEWDFVDVRSLRSGSLITNACIHCQLECKRRTKARCSSCGEGKFILVKYSRQSIALKDPNDRTPTEGQGGEDAE